MILLNKTLPFQRLIVTITDRIITVDSSLKLSVENKESNINYELPLPENTSLYKDRYDEFIIPTSSISTWTPDKYVYQIIEVNSSAVLEIGLLHVIDTAPVQFISIEEDSEADDFIIYSNI